MKDQFLTWTIGRFIQHRNLWLNVGTKEKLVNMIFKFPFSFQDKMWIWYFSSIWSHLWHNTQTLPTSIKKKKITKLYSCQCASQPGKMTLGKTHCTGYEKGKMKVLKQNMPHEKIIISYLFGDRNTTQIWKQFIFNFTPYHHIRWLEIQMFHLNMDRHHYKLLLLRLRKCALILVLKILFYMLEKIKNPSSPFQ